MSDYLQEHRMTPERHELAEQPNWSTKQRCSCGFESVSRCEQWKHQADALRPRLAALTDAARALIQDIVEQDADIVADGMPFKTLLALAAGSSQEHQHD